MGATDELMNQEIELMETPPLEEQEQPETPPEVEPPPPPRREQVQFVPPQVVEAEEAPEDVVVQNMDTVRSEVGATNVEGDPDANPEVLDLGEIGTGTGPVEVQVQRDPDPNEFIMVDEEAKPVNLSELKQMVEYPQMAKDAGITGRVVLRVFVNAQGQYVRHIVSKSPHPWLTAAVEQHINKLRFTPAIQNGNPVPMWVNVPFNFTLNQ
jgi:protein TonB